MPVGFVVVKSLLRRMILNFAVLSEIKNIKLKNAII
jgi:hypothetical protein